MHLACAGKGFTELAEQLVVKYGAAVEALSIKKQTPMHLAAQNGMKEACHKLMHLDAMLDFNDDKDQKPIHLAAQNDHTEVIWRLGMITLR